jgi:hypothetical protein
MSRHKEMREILRILRREGYAVAVTGGNHYRITHPQMVGVVIASATPSDPKHKQALWATIRRQRRRVA